MGAPSDPARSNSDDSSGFDRTSSEALEFALETLTIGRVNFASAQNDVAVVRKLTLRNNTLESIDDLTITLTANPPVIREKPGRSTASRQNRKSR